MERRVSFCWKVACHGLFLERGLVWTRGRGRWYAFLLDVAQQVVISWEVE